jgi:hypothetical protein
MKSILLDENLPRPLQEAIINADDAQIIEIDVRNLKIE